MDSKQWAEELKPASGLTGIEDGIIADLAACGRERDDAKELLETIFAGPAESIRVFHEATRRAETAEATVKRLTEALRKVASRSQLALDEPEFYLPEDIADTVRDALAALPAPQEAPHTLQSPAKTVRDTAAIPWDHFATSDDAPQEAKGESAGTPNALTLKAMAETERGDVIGPFSTVEELVAELDKPEAAPIPRSDGLRAEVEKLCEAWVKTRKTTRLRCAGELRALLRASPASDEAVVEKVAKDLCQWTGWPEGCNDPLGVTSCRNEARRILAIVQGEKP